jgi:hypothetical protein
LRLTYGGLVAVLRNGNGHARQEPAA